MGNHCQCCPLQSLLCKNVGTGAWVFSLKEKKYLKFLKFGTKGGMSGSAVIGLRYLRFKCVNIEPEHA